MDQQQPLVEECLAWQALGNLLSGRKGNASKPACKTRLSIHCLLAAAVVPPKGKAAAAPQVNLADSDDDMPGPSAAPPKPAQGVVAWMGNCSAGIKQVQLLACNGNRRVARQ
mgnify:CR=1 FL=1